MSPPGRFGLAGTFSTLLPTTTFKTQLRCSLWRCSNSIPTTGFVICVRPREERPRRSPKGSAQMDFFLPTKSSLAAWTSSTIRLPARVAPTSSSATAILKTSPSV